MRRVPLGRTVILAASLFVMAACGSGTALRGAPGHALVVFTAERAADAETAAARLRELGFDVALEPAGSAVREGSSAAVYLAARRPDRVQAVESVVEPLGALTLPFVHSGPEGTDVVIWLADQTVESSPAISR